MKRSASQSDAVVLPAPATGMGGVVAVVGDQVLHWMAALADATRLRLLRLLDQEELGVAELCEVLQLPQSTVSRHLKTLLDGQWLVHRREGTAGLYRLILDELDPARRDLWLVARTHSERWPTAEQDELRLRQLLASRESTGAFFADVAADWDAIRIEQYGQRFDLATAFALLPSDATVIDLGCGTGRLLCDLSPFVGKVVGVDDSPAMLKAARRRVNGTNSVTLKQGQLSAIPLDDAIADAALCVLALSYTDDPAAVVSEMARLLKPGGKAVIVDVLAHDRDDFRRRMGQTHRGFSLDDANRLLSAAGFDAVRTHALPPEPDAKGPALFVAAGKRGHS